MAFELPTIPNLPGVSDIDFSKIDPSNCGSNEALTALDDIQDKIKDALAEGKGALSDLENNIAEANAKLEEGLTKIESAIDEATESFQEDVAAMQTKFGEDFAEAQAALREKWGDVVEGFDDAVSKIPSLTDLISGTKSIDLCKEIQNVEKKTVPWTDPDTGKVIQKTDPDTGKVILKTEVVKKAQAPQMPNVNSEAPPVFEETKVEVQRQPSVVSPSGLSRYETNSEMIDYKFARTRLINTHFKVLKDEIMGAWKLLKKDPLYDKLRKMMKETGKKASELQAEGFLSTEEIAFRNHAHNVQGLIKGFNERKQIFQGLLVIHEEVIGGVAAADDYDKNLKKWVDAGVIKDIDVEKLGWQVQADINSADLIKAYYFYNNKV